MSKRVERRATVFAVGFLPQIVDPELRKEFLGAEKRRYSGGYQNKAIKRGIPVESVEKYPQFAAHLGVSLNDNMWHEKEKIFWAEYNTSIGFGLINENGKIEGGRELNASYTEENGRIICDDIVDYILFEMMQNDREVATNPDLYETESQNYAFFCVDQTVETERAKQLLTYKLEATEAFSKLMREYREAPERMETRMRSIAAAVDSTASGLHFRTQTIDEAIASVLSGSEKDPQKFLKVLEDKNLVIKALINDCVDAGIFQKIGNTYIYKDETFESISELAKFLQSAERSQIKAEIDAQLKEFSAMAIIQS